MTKSKTCVVQCNCDLKYSPLGGGGVTWNEPFPVRTTSNPGIGQVYEGFPITLNWNYSLTSCLSLGVIKFNSDGVVSIRTDDSADPVNAKLFNRSYTDSYQPGKI